MRVLSLLLLAIACASAWLLTSVRPPVQAVAQCPAPVTPAAVPLFMNLALDDELDNPLIEEDQAIRGALPYPCPTRLLSWMRLAT